MISSFNFEAIRDSEQTPSLSITANCIEKKNFLKLSGPQDLQDFKPLVKERRQAVSEANGCFYTANHGYLEHKANGLEVVKKSFPPPCVVDVFDTPVKDYIPPKVKTCVLCKTTKTPLWRDAVDGTPYCNACGIRLRIKLAAFCAITSLARILLAKMCVINVVRH